MNVATATTRSPGPSPTTRRRVHRDAAPLCGHGQPLIQFLAGRDEVRDEVLLFQLGDPLKLGDRSAKPTDLYTPPPVCFGPSPSTRLISS